MDAIVETTAQCPWCLETIDLTIDATAGEQEYVEECPVCSRPIVVHVTWSGDEPRLTLRREGDEQYADG
jgi:hypothetical protein